MTRVAISGADGRMGRTLIETIAETPGVELGAALERSDSPAVGDEVPGTGITIAAELDRVLTDFDVLIDFSVPEATLAAVEICRANGKNMVIGTTGFDAAGLQKIDAAAADIAIMMAPNMSVGVNVTFKLIELAARALGDEVDVEVFEAHHRHKIDAPSGTAVRMGEILAHALGRNLDTDAVYGREGITGARERKTIGFHSLRGGDIVGDHTVTFAGTGERIEITHRAGSRMNFASGAMRAVTFIAERDHGRYGMDDVLGL